MRVVFIVFGVTLIQRFHWVIYLFGAFLILTGMNMARQKDQEIYPERNPVLRLLRRLMPVTDRNEEGHFFVKQGTQYFATPLFVVLLVVESTDVLFAVDRITRTLLCLGWHYPTVSLSPLWTVCHPRLHRVKMLLADIYKVPIAVALSVVSGILLISVIASMIRPRQVEGDPASAGAARG